MLISFDDSNGSTKQECLDFFDKTISLRDISLLKGTFESLQRMPDEYFCFTELSFLVSNKECKLGSHKHYERHFREDQESVCSLAHVFIAIKYFIENECNENVAMGLSREHMNFFYINGPASIPFILVTYTLGKWNILDWIFVGG